MKNDVLSGVKVGEVIPSRLVPEGSVVLTKEQLKKLGKYVDITEDVKKEFQRELERVRKETKREVLKKLNGFRFVMYDEGYEVASWTCDDENVEQFAKEIGMEVEE